MMLPVSVVPLKETSTEDTEECSVYVNEPSSSSITQLLDKYGGVAFDYGAMPRLVAVHSLMDDGGTSNKPLKTNSLGENLNGLHSPSIGEEAPEMASRFKSAFCKVCDGRECRGVEWHAFSSGQAVHPGRETADHQQTNEVSAQSDVGAYHNIIDMSKNDKKKTPASRSSQRDAGTFTVHWKASCKETENKQMPGAQGRDETKVSQVEDSRAVLQQECCETFAVIVHDTLQLRDASSSVQSTIDLTRNEYYPVDSDVNDHQTMDDPDNGSNSNNKDNKGKDNKRVLSCPSHCDGKETVRRKSTRKRTQVQVYSAPERAERTSLQVEKRKLLKKREGILQKMRHIMRGRRKKVRAKTWAVPSYSEEFDWIHQNTMQEEIPSKKSHRSGIEEKEEDHSWPSKALVVNGNGNTSLMSEKCELSPSGRYCRREKATEDSRAVVTLVNSCKVNVCMAATDLSISATRLPSMEVDGPLHNERDVDQVPKSVMSGTVVLPCKDKKPGREDLTVGRTGPVSELAAVVDVHQEVERCTTDRVEGPHPRKRSRKSIPRKFNRHTSTEKGRDHGADEVSSSADAVMAAVPGDYRECIEAKETGTVAVPNSLLKVLTHSPDRSKLNTCTSLEAEERNAEGSCARVRPRTSTQSSCCDAGSRNAGVGCQSNSHVFTGRKISPLSPSVLGNSDELSEVMTGKGEGNSSKEEVSVVGSFDRQSIIRELLRKQEQLLKQVQLSSTARNEVF